MHVRCSAHPYNSLACKVDGQLAIWGHGPHSLSAKGMKSRGPFVKGNEYMYEVGYISNLAIDKVGPRSKF